MTVSTPSKPSTAWDTDTKTSDDAETSAAGKTEADDTRFRLTRGLTRSVLLSRLTWMIVAANVFCLAILIIGAMFFREMGANMVQARIDTARGQGEFIADILVQEATEGEPAPALVRDRAVEALDRMAFPQDLRARLWVPPDGTDEEPLRMGLTELVDTQEINQDVRRKELRPPSAPQRLQDTLDRFSSDRSTWFARQFRGTNLDATIDRELEYALGGGVRAWERRNEDGEHIVSVSVPVQHVQMVLGVLTLEVRGMDEVIAKERAAITPYIILAGIAILISSALITLSVAWPVRKLALAADAVRREGPRNASIPELSRRGDEIGELARSFAAMTRALADRISTIEDFVADVAHEIKNPLTSIRSAVDTLPLVSADDQKAKLLGIIRHDVTRIDRLITDISNASRVDAELARAKVAPVDLGPFLQHLVDLYGATTEISRPEVVYDGPSDAAPMLVAALEDPLGQVFRNLIDNAITFSPSSGTVRVSLSHHLDQDGAMYAAATVEDDGPGIPPENFDKIFNRFYTERAEGAAFGDHSGLGLAIARQIVEAHGGRIWAENQMQSGDRRKGARFHVHLPIQRG